MTADESEFAMAVKTLDEFFREKQSHTLPENLDWEKRRDEWVAAIRELYRVVVEDFLVGAISNQSVKADYGFHELSENFLGRYKVPTLILYVSNEQVVFVPKGRNIVGSAGRVDIRGEIGEATLVLQSGTRWMLISQRVPSVSLVPFDAEALLSILKNVMRP